MKLNVTLFHFEELIKKTYSLDLIFLLKVLEEGLDTEELCANSVRVCNLFQTLERKGLIGTDQKLTLQGKELLSFMETEGDVKIAKKKASISEFEQWWKAYPGTDTFVHKGKKFTGTRALRKEKDDCRIKFDKILLEGEYTLQDMLAALQFDVDQKKESSVKTGVNRLTYMQNSLTYLNQRSFEPYIELIRDGAKVEEADKPVGGTDI